MNPTKIRITCDRLTSREYYPENKVLEFGRGVTFVVTYNTSLRFHEIKPVETGRGFILRVDPLLVGAL